MNSGPASFFRLMGPLCQFTTEKCILALLPTPKHSSKKPNLPLYGNSSTFRNKFLLKQPRSVCLHAGCVTSKLGGKWPTSKVLMAQFSFFSSGNGLQSHIKAQSRKPQNKPSHDFGRTFPKPTSLSLPRPNM